MLYIFDDLGSLDDAFIGQCIPYLSMERKEKAFSYSFPPDRNCSVVAYMLLRLALKENYDIDENVTFKYGMNGKPSLQNYPNIHFNLSHCRTAAACIIADCEVGVDVEEIKPVTDEVARRVLTVKEYAEYRASSNSDELFCRYWTAKESWLKRTGLGIGINLSALAAEDTGEKTLIRGKNYCCCATGASVTVRNVKIGGLIV